MGMSSIFKPAAAATVTAAAGTATATAVGTPTWGVAISTVVPLVAGLAVTVADQIRTDRRERRKQARLQADDEHLRRLEQQAVRTARAIADPERRTEVMLWLISNRTAAGDPDDCETQPLPSTGRPDAP